MHIPDGLLPPSVCISGYAVTGGLTWLSLKRINQQKDSQQEIPKASLLTATFFVASLIHIPIPPFSIHLVLNGLMGIVLGYYAFPAILIGLFFQAIFFQHGGLSTLGVNTIIMGIPALVAYFIWQLRKLRNPTLNNFWLENISAFFAGALAVFLSALIFIFITLNNISPDLDVNVEKTALLTSLIGYGIQAIIEGVLTVMIIAFIRKVKPEIVNS